MNRRENLQEQMAEMMERTEGMMESDDGKEKQNGNGVTRRGRRRSE